MRLHANERPRRLREEIRAHRVFLRFSVSLPPSELRSHRSGRLRTGVESQTYGTGVMRVLENNARPRDAPSNASRRAPQASARVSRAAETAEDCGKPCEAVLRLRAQSAEGLDRRTMPNKLFPKFSSCSRSKDSFRSPQLWPFTGRRIGFGPIRVDGTFWPFTETLRDRPTQRRQTKLYLDCSRRIFRLESPNSRARTP
jgi:hypothetical protein